LSCVIGGMRLRTRKDEEEGEDSDMVNNHYRRPLRWGESGG
jgi:hypothetical protein